MKVNRREALGLGALGVLGVAGLSVPLSQASAKAASTLAARNLPAPYRTPFVRPPVLSPVLKEDADGPYQLFTVTARAGTASIVPGLQTPVYGYEGSVPGPTIRVRRGTRTKLRVRNQMPADHPLFGHPFELSTHLHGAASLPQYDGYANDLTPPGYYKDYWYDNWQPARTIWYHDHRVHTSAENAYSGLFAQYHVSDDAETDLLPQGHYDVPVTIVDAMFAADGGLAYNDRSRSGLMGDIILVNGRPWPVLQVKPAIYRFRMLNASISRSLRLRLSDNSPMVVVATDGGLMPKARPVVEYRHAGAERYELLIDFRRYRPGQTVDLRNQSNKNNVDYDHTNKIMRFQVVDAGDLPPDGPADRTLSAVPDLLENSDTMSLTPRMATRTRRFKLERSDRTNLFLIDGKSWKDVEASGFRDLLARVEPDAVEIWEFENGSGGWYHPMHLHLVDFQILSRNGRAPFAHELGPKDVVYAAEGETLRLLTKFTLQEGGGNSRNAGGRYMIHCHNLPHEDHDMMHQFAVGDPTVNDPIASAPPRFDDGRYDDDADGAAPVA